jgi:hypothetical protein
VYKKSGAAEFHVDFGGGSERVMLAGMVFHELIQFSWPQKRPSLLQGR